MSRGRYVWSPHSCTATLKNFKIKNLSEKIYYLQNNQIITKCEHNCFTTKEINIRRKTNFEFLVMKHQASNVG